MTPYVFCNFTQNWSVTIDSNMWLQPSLILISNEPKIRVSWIEITVCGSKLVAHATFDYGQQISSSQLFEVETSWVSYI